MEAGLIRVRIVSALAIYLPSTDKISEIGYRTSVSRAGLGTFQVDATFAVDARHPVLPGRTGRGRSYSAIHVKIMTMMRNPDQIRRPSFVGIGPVRTATTWLHEALRGHVALPRGIKETHFFPRHYSRGIDWYLKHFRGYSSNLLVGEIDPTCFDFPEASERINQQLPGCKVICSLRDPVQRTYSHYRHLQTLGYIGHASFEQTIESHLGFLFQPGNMIGTSYYAFHLKRWLEILGRDRVLVTFFDDMEAHPQQFIDNITEFIGAPRIDLLRSAVAAKRINSRETSALHPGLAGRVRRLRDELERRRMYRTTARLDFFFRYSFGRGKIFPSIDPRTARSLREYFRPEIEELEQLVRRDLTSWKN